MIFLDSSFLVAFGVDGDANHAKAVEVMRDIVKSAYGPPVISDYVFDETTTVTFLRTKELQKARVVGDAMLKAFRMLKVDDEVFRRAWQEFKSQKGTKYSFTDSTTVELMRQNNIRNIATFDREFRSYKELVVVGKQ
ncbi:MAG: PIN domain-containing protein [Nitrososphaerales archaeon]|nr:PIN domain-containing protein [Nitrososphaerales archaeon]